MIQQVKEAQQKELEERLHAKSAKQDQSTDRSSSSSSSSSTSSHKAAVLAKFDEINSVSNQLKKCLAKADRRKLEVRNELLRKMLEGNRVIVFPSRTL